MAGERIAGRVALLLADARAATEAGDHTEARLLARAILAMDPENEAAATLVAGADQRIQMTLMFCDLVGSTPLADRCDPEEMAAILREYRRLGTTAIGRYGGFIEDRKGDGLLVRFGYPLAHEDDARRAVLGGLEIVRRITAHPLGLSVRIAVHTGLVVLDGDEVVGATPNEAARLQGFAAADTVVISETTLALVRGHFDVRSQGQATLRGVSRPIEIFTVIGERSGDRLHVGDDTTPFTGRRAELAVVCDLWKQAGVQHARGVAESPTAVLLCGPAGIGKSRLARESVHALDARCLTGGCSSYGATTSLHPFVGLLKSVCDITPQDDSLTRLAKLRARMTQFVGGTGGDLPVLTAALSISLAETSPMTDIEPARLRTLALQAAADLLSSAAADGPVILLIEDLQWADDSTLELISLLLGSPCAGMLLLMTTRPDFACPWPENLVPHLVLEPLPTAALARMTRCIADGADLDDAHRDELIARSDGIPLYLEELMRSGAAPRSHVEVGDMPFAAASRIPVALRDPLLARLVLPGVDLALVQLAATIGRDVDDALLQRASGLGDKAFQSKLANLAAAELVDLSVDGSIRFRHDLLRDAAYETQRHSVCRERHGQIADLLRELAPEGRGAGAVALHLERAERHAEAIEALFEAARADQALGAHQEAMTRLARILELLERLPMEPSRWVGELTARQLRSFGATMTGGYSAPETAQDHARCVELCERLGLAPELLPSLVMSWAFYTFRGEMTAASKVCATLQRLASEPGLPERTVALVRQIRGMEQFYFGAFEEAETIMRDFLRHPDWQADEAPESGWPVPHDPVASVSGFLVALLGMRGRYEEAFAFGAAAVRRAARLRFPFGPFSVSFLKSQLAHVHVLDGNFEAALQLGREYAELGDRHGFVLWSTSGRMVQLSARTHLGESDAVDTLAAVVAEFRALLSAELWSTYWLTELGSAQMAAGRRADARASLDEALRVSSVTRGEFYTAETLRLRGVLRCDDGDGGGLDDLRAAVRMARAQRATGLELRALNALEPRGARQPATP